MIDYGDQSRMPPPRPACITDAEYAHWRGATPMAHGPPCHDCIGAYQMATSRPITNDFTREAIERGVCVLGGAGADKAVRVFLRRAIRREYLEEEGVKA